MNKNNTTSKGTVFVGVSGGVDSSVSAYLLKKEGYKVVGVFIRTWQPDWVECTWRDERRDAIRVCAELNIPFLECDLEERYKKEVADYMIAEYKKGRTPNPDVMCNKEVKFGGFIDFAKAHGADFIATGHYAQKKEKNGNFELHKGNDPEKDQSYFLWTLTQQQLAQTLFPVGHLPKSEVRMLAKKAGLHTASKKDSQGICFLGKISMKDFLSHYVEEKEGIVFDDAGKEIGHHPGAVFFTLGERHGFTVTEKGSIDKPYYVISKDIDKNIITVSNDPALAVSAIENSVQSVLIKNTNWIGEDPKTNFSYQARSRYRQKTKSATITSLSEKEAAVTFTPESLIAPPGQSLVFYEGMRCLGGGIIEA